MSKIFFSYLFKTNLSALHAAILSDNTNKICRILDVKRDYIHKELDNKGNTALLLAMKHASPVTVRLLLEEGASPDQPNFVTFQTPLGFIAATVYEKDQLQVAKLALEMAVILLDHGADVDKPSPYTCLDENGKGYVIMETPLMTAVRTRSLPLAKLFVQKKANVNYIEKIFENRPIHFSITNGDVAMFDLLENAGASCRSVVSSGQNTLLHCFCHHKANDEQMSLLEKLINNGCDINAENSIRRTPLMLAAGLDMINTCYVLINAHADINKIDYKGYQAISFAKPDSECFKLLKQVIYIQHIKTQSHHNKDRVHLKKQYHSTYTLSTQKSEPPKQFNNDKTNIEDQNNLLRSESDRAYNAQDINTKYKNMWEKLLEAKQTTGRTRDLSVERPMKSAHQRNKDLSKQRTKDFNEKKFSSTLEL
ncbi:unnamed protein product [Rotaria sp. Silwood2]|nr:unnamed protein product [Rotaria sp. Silwood2]CAF2522394.1 unnamed protein product [Rotaria sp. Silwood2]CAF2782471.1 unnamed protein product [Rotaria sp. Silwood2]CAF2955829.1 unnamed protein product [Rotaria sp. Silwood2]CAF4168482.1 unnamed protein product [Rotaria sp. Silwood2]